jgi:mannose-6-phosphate isomerase-like protein (cupin superfamily)
MEHGINLHEKLTGITDHWSPRTITTFNQHDIMVVKVDGEFVWHSHEDTDDFFLVLSGRLVLRLRDQEIVLEPGELYVVPAGVEHQPFAPEETTLLLIEPTGTPNTGDPATAAPRVTI